MVGGGAGGRDAGVLRYVRSTGSSKNDDHGPCRGSRGRKSEGGRTLKFKRMLLNFEDIQIANQKARSHERHTLNCNTTLRHKEDY